MAEIARWNGHKFEVSSSLIRGFTGLTLKGSSETEEKEYGGQKYVARKSGKPKEISLTIHLDMRLGCDVRTELVKFVDEAAAGSKDYFYVASKKLVESQMMLTSADVSGFELTSNGTVKSADVKITMSQCSKNDGTMPTTTSSSSSSSSKKASTKTTSTKTTTTSSAAGIASAVIGAVVGGLAAVSAVSSTAKAVSAAKSTTTPAPAKTASSGLSKLMATATKK